MTFIMYLMLMCISNSLTIKASKTCPNLEQKIFFSPQWLIYITVSGNKSLIAFTSQHVGH